MSSQAPYLSGGPFAGRHAWWPVFPGHRWMRLPMVVRHTPAECVFGKGAAGPEDGELEVAVYELEERRHKPVRLSADDYDYLPAQRFYVYVFRGME